MPFIRALGKPHSRVSVLFFPKLPYFPHMKLEDLKSDLELFGDRTLQEDAIGPFGQCIKTTYTRVAFNPEEGKEFAKAIADYEQNGKESTAIQEISENIKAELQIVFSFKSRRVSRPQDNFSETDKRRMVTSISLLSKEEL